MKRIISAVVVLIGLAMPASASFDEGMAAYKRGDYATALREWRPLAEDDHALAQHKIGLMYFKGQGLPRKLELALLHRQGWQPCELVEAQGSVDGLRQHATGENGGEPCNGFLSARLAVRQGW